MKPGRTCRARNQQGEPCRQPPLRDRDRCFWHDPEHAAAANEARRLGGHRRRREGTVAGAYDFDGLTTVPQIRRLLEVAAYDALSLDNSIARVRAITAVAQAAARLLETGELEDRINALEQAMTPEPSLFK